MKVLPRKRQRFDLRKVPLSRQVEDGEPYPCRSLLSRELCWPRLEPDTQPHHNIEIASGKRKPQGPVSFAQDLVLVQKTGEGCLLPERSPLRKSRVLLHQPPEDEDRGEVISRRFHLTEQRTSEADHELRGQNRRCETVHDEGQFPVLVEEELSRLVSRPAPHPALGVLSGGKTQEITVIGQQDHHKGPSRTWNPFGKGRLGQLGQCSVGHQLKDQTAPSFLKGNNKRTSTRTHSGHLRLPGKDRRKMPCGSPRTPV